jgi:quinol monooxygenase YgiN
MDKIEIYAKFTSIDPANLAGFKAAIAEVVALATDEADTLQYDWSFNEDETKCVVREAYTDSAAVLTHMDHVGEALERLFALGGAFDVDSFGDASPELLAVGESFGAVVYKQFAGL